jgi:hypothetical protein
MKPFPSDMFCSFQPCCLLPIALSLAVGLGRTMAVLFCGRLLVCAQASNLLPLFLSILVRGKSAAVVGHAIFLGPAP